MMQYFKRWTKKTPKCDIRTSQMDKFFKFDFDSYKSVTYVRH